MIDKKFYALIGETVVGFGQLEDNLRFSVSGHISPGIETEPGLSIFSRVRFSELLEMYEVVIGYAVTKAEFDERITVEAAEKARVDLKCLCKELSSVNERRNAVVHSAYFESEHIDVQGRVSRLTLTAFKPNRKGLSLTEDFNPFQNIPQEIAILISDIRAAEQHFLEFDIMALPYINAFWESFALRVIEEQKAGALETRELRYPSLRIRN